MEHSVLDSLVGGRVSFRVRDLSGDIFVVIGRIFRLVIRTHDEQNVCVRETTLLKLDDMDHGDNFPKNLFLQQVVEKLLQLDVKDAGSQVRTVDRCLMWEKLRRDFRPLGIARKRDEIIRVGGVCTHNGHCILIQLVHRPRSAKIT